ncbi:hypothetical protein NMY22_g11350 [Coprinellus aureogranulatus]|nr:hypothetical protein NMY22_g11350 [Coprinellus aureogranulatus]
MHTLSNTIIQIPFLIFAKAGECVASIGSTSAQDSSSTHFATHPAPASYPNPALLAAAVGRRRRRITPDQSDLGLSASAGATLPSNPQVILSSGSVPIHMPRPKSLQHARQWAGKTTAISTSFSTPPVPKLPRIDVHVQFARNCVRTFVEFCQYFKYDAPRPSANQTPAEMQAIMEDMYENPVRVMMEGRVVRSLEQPDQVVHQMFWQGDRMQMSDALKTGLGSVMTLQSLSITHCPISLVDVVAILVNWPSLDSLEVRDIVPNEQAGSRLLDRPGTAGRKFHRNLSTLKVTSYIVLDPLFESIQLHVLSSLSLRLHDDANWTTWTMFQDLLPAFTTTLAVKKPSLYLHGRLSPSDRVALEESLAEGVALEYIESCDNCASSII